MRIAIDCHTLEIDKWAGKEKFLVSVLEECIKYKDEVFVLYFRRKAELKFSLPDNFVIVNKNIPTPFWQLFVIIDLLVKRIDVVLCPCTYLLPVLNLFTKNVIVVHDLTTLLTETKNTHKLMTRFKEKLLLGLALKNSEKVIAVSNSTKNDCIKFFDVKPKKIEVVHLAAHNRFRVIEDRKETISKIKKYNLSSDYILFVGTLEPRKNIEGLIRAYKELQNNKNFPILVIVGKKGWYFEGIFNLVKKLNLEEKVILTGYVKDEDLPYLYNGACFFVYPSFYEGFGLPVLEAMACGCPVITSNISSLPEVAGGSAVLVDPNNEDGLSEAMSDLYKNKELRKKLKEEGLLHAKNFSWQKTVDKIIDIIKEIDLKK
jgi:glycosyltransferase involved in cell wall biosynthesis